VSPVAPIQSHAPQRLPAQQAGTDFSQIAPGTCVTKADPEGNVEGNCKLAPEEAANPINSPFS
jgi:hypothetical protein